MEEIKQKRLVVLEDACSYFNLNTRNSNEFKACKYYPVSDKSEGCAVGRLIKDKKLCKRMDLGFEFGGNGTFVRYNNPKTNIFKFRVIKLGNDYESDVQFCKLKGLNQTWK